MDSTRTQSLSLSPVHVKESLRGRLAQAREDFLRKGGVEKQIPAGVFGEDAAARKPYSEAMRKINNTEAEQGRIRKESRDGQV